jgi:hypothetical protein
VKTHAKKLFQVLGVPRTLAIFAAGEFAPNEVRMFSKRVLEPPEAAPPRRPLPI